MFFKLGCNSFFPYFFPHAFAKIIPVAQALLFVRKEYLHQQEKQFTEQLKLITEISIWKQSKPRIVEIAGSPCSRKCSALHGGKAVQVDPGGVRRAQRPTGAGLVSSAWPGRGCVSPGSAGACPMLLLGLVASQRGHPWAGAAAWLRLCRS